MSGVAVPPADLDLPSYKVEEPLPDFEAEVFGAAGALARHFPGYEPRAGQVKLSKAVCEAMAADGALLAEGPCGTGKSVAYLAPAIYRAHFRGEKTLVVTANIALQHQLVDSDLPMLRKVLPWDFTHALLKGRSNYLCNLALEKAADDVPPDYREEVDRVLAWAKTTTTGDRGELSFEPLPATWRRFAVGAEECIKKACPHYEGACYPNGAKARAGGADIIVTNYHMLFVHILVRMQTGMDLVLPEVHHLVLDEAHEAADVARDFFGATVSEGSIKHLTGQAFKIPAISGKVIGALLPAAGDFFRAAVALMRSPAYQDRGRLRPGDLQQPGERLSVALRGLAADAARAAATGELLSETAKARCVGVGERSTRLADALREALTAQDSNRVYFLEPAAGGERAVLKSKVVQVGEILRDNLWNAWSSVTATSATMTTGGHFKFIRAELGVPEAAREVVAETPFDFRAQALLVVPRDVPHPTRMPASFNKRVAETIGQAIEQCGGRTLCLFTSYKGMSEAVLAVRKLDLRDENNVPYGILVQGELPRSELSRRFKEDPASVLLGVSSFWTGIDVPGDALQCVVIDKLPFPNQSDPVVAAISEADKRSFHTYSIPKACMMLRQGVGRLVRSRRDVGAIIICDPRIVTENYGASFMRSLPDMNKGREVAKVRKFIEWAKGKQVPA